MKGLGRTIFQAILVTICVCLLLTTSGLAQRSTGTVAGTVLDPTGAVVSGAKVTVTNMGTNVARTFVTDNSGAFMFPSMDPGRYRLTAEKTGFKETGVNGVELSVDQTRRVDLKLAIGKTTETVEVNASALHVETGTADVSSTISGQDIRSLPILSRNYMEAIGWRAGVTPGYGSSTDWVQGWVSPGSHGAWSSTSSVTNYNVGGGRVSQNTYAVDGLTNTNTAYGSSGVTPSMDAIEEVKIETSYYSSESKGTSMVNVTTKSGTNSYHGSGFESYRGAPLQPTDPRTADPVTGLPYKPPYSYNQYGGSFGGPIRVPGFNGRDRTFFFVSYEGMRFRDTSVSPVNQIDPAWRTGDFSNYKDAKGNLILIYDPANLDPLGNRIPFPGNKIPGDRIASQSSNYLQMFVPTAAAGGSQVLALTNRYNIGNLTLRVDHNISDHDKLYGRFNLQTTDNHEASYTKYSDGLLNMPAKNVAIVHTHIFGPRLVNELRLGYARTLLGMQLDSSGGSHNYGEEAGFANVSSDPMAWAVPRISFRANLISLGPSLSVESDLTNTYQLYDVASWVRGRHSWKFGVDVRRDRDRVSKANSSVSGALRFWNGYTGSNNPLVPSPPQAGNYFGDFLLGLASYARIAVPYRNYPSSWQTAFFCPARLGSQS